jgi:hypothetical protein
MAVNYDHNDFQDQAALIAALQRQKMLNSQNQSQRIPANRKCPWCGGLLPGKYPKCTHCASDISWVGIKPFQPGSKDEERARKRLSAENIEVRQIKIEDRQIVACATCQDRREKRYLYDDGLCASCHYKREIQRKKEEIQRKKERPLVIFVLIVITAILILLINTFN